MGVVSTHNGAKITDISANNTFDGVGVPAAGIISPGM
jgi:hypothetical protein